jgi:chorismate mutase
MPGAHVAVLVSNRVRHFCGPEVEMRRPPVPWGKFCLGNLASQMADDRVALPVTDDGAALSAAGARQAGPGGPAPAKRTRALRGATTVDEDTADQVRERTQALLTAMVERNDVEHEDIISVLFTATNDIHSVFPATAARGIGFGDVPLLCARELDIEGGQPRCIRVLMHVDTSRRELHHVYLEGARGLRDDLPE